MSTSTRVHIVLPNDTLERVDAQRGLIPRSAYIRDLVEMAVSFPDFQPRKEGQPALAKAAHRHRRDELIREDRVKGQVVKIYRCDCGEILR